MFRLDITEHSVDATPRIGFRLASFDGNYMGIYLELSSATPFVAPKTVLRIITHSSPSEDSYPLFKKRKILNVQDIFKHLVLLFFF